jgi:copper homeostasis protein (lipoprotein)
MSMSDTRTSLAIALLAGLSLAACSHMPASGGDAAFAGTYAGMLPCADCPGIDTSIVFAADGGYVETMSYRERDTTNTSRGHWTLDADGKRVKLHADEANASDAWMEIVSPGEIRMLDADGNPIESDLDYSLRRTPQSP